MRGELTNTGSTYCSFVPSLDGWRSAEDMVVRDKEKLLSQHLANTFAFELRRASWRVCSLHAVKVPRENGVGITQGALYIIRHGYIVDLESR